MIDIKLLLGPDDIGYKVVLAYSKETGKYTVAGYIQQATAFNVIHSYQDGAVRAFDTMAEAVKFIAEVVQ